jgi:hypothetical protein
VQEDEIPHKEPTIYTLTDDDIDRIGLPSEGCHIEEAVQQVLQLQEDMNKKVQEKLMTLQQWLEVMSIAPERRSVEGQPTSVVGEARATTSYLPEIAAGHQILKISPEVIEFPMLEMKEQAQVLSHLDLVLSQIPMEALQGLQVGVVHRKYSSCRINDKGVNQGSDR